MPPREPFIFIAGRSSRQGTSLNESKFGRDYLDETSTVLVHPDDLAELGIAAGERVRLRSDYGSCEVVCQATKPGDQPRGLLFMAYGDNSSKLMGGDTHGTGMPTSKGVDVQLERAP